MYIEESNPPSPKVNQESGPTVESYSVDERGEVSFVNIELWRIEQLNMMLDTILLKSCTHLNYHTACASCRARRARREANGS